MNRIALVEARDSHRRYFAIEVDGRPLHEHFVGPRGAHPSRMSPVGWSSADPSFSRLITEQFLLLASSGLQSGRVPVLVCEECGDVACGAIATRIERKGASVTWSDWAYENGYESAQELSWPTYPKLLEFDAAQYEEVFAGVLPSG